MTKIKLIVGLGNPGLQYTDTRHNVGAWFLRELAAQSQTSLKPESKFHGLAATCNIGVHQCRLLEPTTFMNDSGLAVRSILQFYKLSPEEILVAHDELDFEPGVVRLKYGGGHGGHNGLRDIVSHLGTPNFYRLRIGIGHPGDKRKVSGFVLGEPNKKDKEEIMFSIADAMRCVEDLVDGEFEAVMNRLHSE